MSQFNFKFLGFSLRGSGDIIIKVPGKFSGQNPIDLKDTGRYLKEGSIWSDSAATAITLIQLVDTDSVVPDLGKSAYPNYPAIMEFLEAPEGGERRLPIAQNLPIKIEAFNNQGISVPQFLPAGLYFKVSVDQPPDATLSGHLLWGVYQ